MRRAGRLVRDIEGGVEPRSIDAPHWIRVYSELIREVDDIASRHPEHAASLLAASRRLRGRLEFWKRLLDAEAAG